MVDSNRLTNAVTIAQAAFWAALAEQYPEIESGDFPPDAQQVFDSACAAAAEIWVEANQP